MRDYGPGVPEEALKKIFEPFFRVDDSRASATGGVGLGLTITDRAIKLHDGRVWAENVPPGLKVLFEIPLAAGTEPPLSPNVKAASRPVAPAHSG
jgi:signal transduction histidine kinase